MERSIVQDGSTCQNKDMKTLSERQYYKQIVSQNLRDKASQYPIFAFVEQEMGRRLLESLDLIKINPTLILDLGSGTGHDAQTLGTRYPKAQIIQLDLSEAMLHVSKGKHNTTRLDQAGPASIPAPTPVLCADAEAIPLQSNSVDMVFSNGLLPWLPDCDIIFKEIRRVLKAGGLFLFSSFGPDTLKECNQILSQMNMRNVHENALLMDMHDIGDQLVQASFESPVMDTSFLKLEYQSPFALLRDLHRTGWSYAVPSMIQSELKDFLKFFEKHYECYKEDARSYPATLEVVIGHAWCGIKKIENAELKTVELKLI